MNQRQEDANDAAGPLELKPSSLSPVPDLQTQFDDLKLSNAELRNALQQSQAEAGIAQTQVDAMKTALGALRALAQQTSDGTILRMQIQELADSALNTQNAKP